MSEVSAFLKALTPQAKACIGEDPFPIPHFPFKVGRESRNGKTLVPLTDRRSIDSVPHNDLYLRESGHIIYVSREHFQIEQRDGQFYLVDRGSTCGTLVEGRRVGKNKSGGETFLEDGDVIFVGSSSSPFAFKFMTKL